MLDNTPELSKEDEERLTDEKRREEAEQAERSEHENLEDNEDEF